MSNPQQENAAGFAGFEFHPEVDRGIAAAAQEERFTRIKLEEGHALHEAYPPNAKLRPLYLKWRKSQPEYEQYPFAFKDD